MRAKLSRIESLETRRLLAGAHWGEELYREANNTNAVEAISLADGGLIVNNGASIKRLNAAGAVLWSTPAPTGLTLLEASVSPQNPAVIWAVAGNTTASVALRLNASDGVIALSQSAQASPYIQALSDGRLAFLSGSDPLNKDLSIMRMDGSIQSVTDIGIGTHTGISADAADNVFVSGTITTSESPRLATDGVLNKVASSGSFLWKRKYNVGEQDFFEDVSVDGAGNAWVGARLLPDGATTLDAAVGTEFVRIVKYSPAGAIISSPDVAVGSATEIGDSVKIRTSGQNGIVAYENLSGGPAGFFKGFAGDNKIWTYSVVQQPAEDFSVTPAGGLLIIGHDVDGQSVLRLPEFRTASTFTIPGSNGDDNINVFVRDTRVIARRGSDRLITATASLQTIRTDLLGGNDTLVVDAPFNVSAIGGAGDDSITSSRGTDTLDGGDGNDLLQARGKNDILFGGIGRDSLYGGAGSDSISGDGGADMIVGGVEHEDVSTSSDTISGGGGRDSIRGSFGNDLIYGGDFNDTIDGLLGLDTVFGEGGDDQISDNDHQNQLFGGPGSDAINALGDRNTVRGGSGDDVMFFNGAGNTGYGGTGNDSFYAGPNSILFGGEGADTFQNSLPEYVQDLEPIDTVIPPNT